VVEGWPCSLSTAMLVTSVGAAGNSSGTSSERGGREGEGRQARRHGQCGSQGEPGVTVASAVTELARGCTAGPKFLQALF
jgi:hypothetical protein